MDGFVGFSGVLEFTGRHLGPLKKSTISLVSIAKTAYTSRRCDPSPPGLREQRFDDCSGARFSPPPSSRLWSWRP